MFGIDEGSGMPNIGRTITRSSAGNTL